MDENNQNSQFFWENENEPKEKKTPEQDAFETLWHNESREGAPAPEPTKPPRKSHTGLAVVIAVLLTLAVGIAACFLLDYAALSFEEGKVQLYVGENASFRAKQQSKTPSETPRREVESYLSLEDTPRPTEAPAVVGQELSVRQIAKLMKPSTVGIVSTVKTAYATGEASGSGIIMSEDGYIVTNAHVIEDASAINVILDDGNTYTAKVIGSDSDADIAVIKIEATKLPAATFASSETVEVGDPVVAIGNPYGMELAGTVTAGIISAKDREITIDEDTFTLLQTDAAINSGNSGGPLINAYGQVIGINSIKLSDTYADGLGFAIPTDVFKPIVDELVQYGYVSGKPAIGIVGQMMTKEYSVYYGIPIGFLIDSFRTMEPMKAGLRKGDIITAIDGKTFETMAEMNAIKDKHKAGDTVVLKVYRDDNFYDNRDGSYLTVELTLCDENEIENTTLPSQPGQ